MEIQPTTPPAVAMAPLGLPLPLNEVGETVELDVVLEPVLGCETIGIEHAAPMPVAPAGRPYVHGHV